MIRLLGEVPRDITVACSGGIDSMVLLDFLNKKHNVDVAFFDHGTESSNQAKNFLTNECEKRNLRLTVGTIDATTRDSKLSLEEYWRIKRYAFLSQFPVVATAHHLDDVVETWVWSSLHGQSKLMPFRRNNVIRPFLLNKKTELEEWAKHKNVNFIFDKSNNDISFTRNYIRHEMMHNVLRVNKGIHTMLKKKLISRGTVI